ncbi:OLC1v1019168C1 [Oldenlandia corymbosa var. corymbosa]|uniref:OLC1v1019168C1 n=1 Tax=Oldenlandia corymbosa var. corymbosa TaxID=529605 RepID=A0AAV1EDA9_OLDCO|nr:OLC1v1019168C1 [Oldenlandia corymbosa var. corymbosa]
MLSQIFAIDMGRLIAGAANRGEFEERLVMIVDEVKESNGEIILFIDEVHTLVGAGAGNQPLDAANILKPPLARGELKCIGATTLEEYRKYIEKDPALKRRFQVVQVPEPSIDETIEILKGIKRKFEVYHNVVYPDEALIAAAKLSKQFISDAFLPDKAVDIMDEAGARVVLYGNNKTNGEASNQQNYGGNGNGQLVSVEVIKQVISSRTGIPVENLSSDESIRLLNMENIFAEQIIGQDDAIQAVSRAIRRSRVGLSDPDRPIATFFFTGPTGVGKTQVAKLVAKEYFGSKESMVRLDMSEYMEKHSVARLFGSPPGYLGHDDGGQLTESVRRKPHSLVLFDEVDKAHVQVFDALLQILDDGRLTDGKGRVVDFKNTIIIMTSNIGFNSTYNHETQGNVREALKRKFRPEFLNRLDEIIVFQGLGKTELMKIVDVLLKEVSERIAKSKNISLQFSMTFKEKLISESGCYDANNYGARPLRRAITRNLEDQLADKVLNGSVKEGDSILVQAISNGDVVFS